MSASTTLPREDALRLVLAHATREWQRGQFDVADDWLTRAQHWPGLAGDAQARLVLRAARGRLLAERVFWDGRSVAEGRALLEAVRQDAVAAGRSDVQAEATDALGFLDYAERLNAGAQAFPQARALFQEALALRVRLGAPGPLAESLFHLGLTHEMEGRLPEAKPLYERALALAEAAQEPVVLAYALRHLAGVREAEGALPVALEMHRRCLALREKAGASLGVPFALLAIGDVERQLGGLSAAEPSYRQALAVARELGQAQALVWASVAVGALELERKQEEAAVGHFARALELSRAHGILAGVRVAAGHLARLHARAGRDEEARRFERLAGE